MGLIFDAWALWGVSQLNKLKNTAMRIYASYVLLLKKYSLRLIYKFELTETAKHPAH